MRSGARAGFRSRLSPDWSGAAGRGRRGREGPPALTLPEAEALRGGAVWGPGPRSPNPLPRRPHSCGRAHPLGGSAGSPACARRGLAAPHWVRRRRLAAGWPPSGLSPGRPLRAPGVGPAGDPLRLRVGAGSGAGNAGAAGGTSATGPGRGRAATGGSCSPAVVGGASGSCAVHRGLFHICNNR